MDAEIRCIRCGAVLPPASAATHTCTPVMPPSATAALTLSAKPATTYYQYAGGPWWSVSGGAA